jgi:hypothetical protein
VATRHHGYSLRELSNQPVHIYLCVVKDSELTLKEKLRADDVSILSWALMLMPGDARSDLKEILESMERKLGNVFYVNPVKK